MTRGLSAMLALCAFVWVAVQPGRAADPPAASSVVSPVASPVAVDLDAMIRALADESLCVPLEGLVASTAIHSSRDQGSVSREESVSWFSEADSGNAIRIDRVDGRSEWVLAELEGAGAITRIVVSSPAAMRDAVLRVRVDGSAQPAIEWRLREIEGVIAPRFAPFGLLFGNFLGRGQGRAQHFYQRCRQGFAGDLAIGQQALRKRQIILGRFLCQNAARLFG